MKAFPIVILGLSAIYIVLILIGGILGMNYTTLAAPLEAVLKEDVRNEGISASARYKGYYDTSTLIFDLQEAGAGEKSRLDVFRVLIQFAERLKDREFQTVILAFRGEGKFTLAGDYFRTLGSEYGEQNPAYTVRTFPENLRNLDGTQAYGTWTGGMIGVLKEQMEDFGDFHDKWYVDGSIGRRETMVETFWASLIFSALVMAWITGFLSSWLATTKGRDSTAWFWIGFFCGPIGILALGLSPTLESASSDESQSDDSLSAFPKSKICPRCHEQIKFQAIVCRYCGHDFGEENVAESLNQYQQEMEANRERTEAERLKSEMWAQKREQQRRFESDLESPSTLCGYMQYWAHLPSDLDKYGYIEKLILAGASVNYKSPILRITPLHNASMYRDANIIKLLLENGADVNATDWLGRSPLDYGIRLNKPAAIAMIQNAGGMKGKDIAIRNENDARQRRMVVTLACENCGRELSVPIEHRGKSGVCNHCGARITVP